MNIQDSVEKIKGVGKVKAKYLNQLGIQSIEDLFKHYPMRYIDKSNVKNINEIRNNEHVTIKGQVTQIMTNRRSRRKTIVTIRVLDENQHGFKAVFFNGAFVLNRIKKHETYFFSGEFKNGQMNHPEFLHENSQEIEDFLGIIPVYGLTKGLKQWQLEKIMRSAFSLCDLSIFEPLPQMILEKNKLCPYAYAIKNIHFPENKRAYKTAKYRLIYEEFFNIQLGMILMKNDFNDITGIPFKDNTRVNAFIDDLPFELTDAQSRVLGEIRDDMASPYVMNRLIQGDVGSGKTIVAFIAMYLCVLNGYQCAFMAPTEILANQHYENFKKLFDAFDVSVTLLTGSIKTKEKIHEAIRANEVQVVIGTHALIQDSVVFKNIGLVITDEQHRFGVRQRQKLSENQESIPDVLVMSATPIPRTLSMVLYGDLDISIIDEMPKGRKDIKTHYIAPKKKHEMYAFLREQLDQGRQGYFVCPLIEKSDSMELTAVEDHVDFLKTEVFSDYHVEMIHGQMKNEEKDRIMQAYKNKEIQVLVSTTVIEVGIDVPNANFMVIEDAERFGLSQLHQLRGRVGRGAYQSYCFLLSERLGKQSKERIKVMTQTNNGFIVSEKDLEIRGPGEVLGFRQSGIPEFRLASLVKHQDILEMVQRDVIDLLKNYQSGEDYAIRDFIDKRSKHIFTSYKRT